LCDAGFYFGQGFLFSKAVEAPKVINLLRENARYNEEIDD
jgi:EAL domain-containing protein (putative c-di-GMP-specific phosphodiesterase class I)